MLKPQFICGVSAALTFVLGGEVWGQDVEKRMASPAIQLTSVKTRKSGTVSFIQTFGLTRNDLARIRQLPHVLAAARQQGQRKDDREVPELHCRMLARRDGIGAGLWFSACSRSILRKHDGGPPQKGRITTVIEVLEGDM